MLGRQTIFFILFGFPAVLAGASHSVAAGAQLSLPFDCKVENGNIRLTPASEQSLAIVGARQERVVLACAEGRPVQCRTMIAHNFAVMCGGARVPWMRVAEAIGGRRTSRIWREGDQLNIALRDNDPEEGAVASAAPCAPQRSGGGQSEATPDGSSLMERVVLKPCNTHAARELHFVLPAGFAPVSHFGARIVVEATETSATTGIGARVPRQPVLAAAARPDIATPATRQRLLERTILTEPLPDIDAVRPPPDETARDLHAGRSRDDSESAVQRLARASEELRREAAGSGVPPAPGERPVKVNEASQRVRTAWSVTVTPMVSDHSSDAGGAASYASASAEPRPTTQRDVMLWLVLTSMFVTAGWIVWSRPERFAILARRVSGGAIEGLLGKAPVARAAVGLFSRVSGAFMSLRRADRQGSRPAAGGGFPATGLEAAYGGVLRVVGSLPANVPLRTVLDDELQRVRRRLALARASSNDGQVPATAYRVLMRDLERIGRIGESARDSVATSGRGVGLSASGSGHMPQNRAEAFQLLGLNANVSEATIKKCVEALRMSWHPDLAHDAADLALREERIKQINVAMELISGKPQQD